MVDLDPVLKHRTGCTFSDFHTQVERKLDAAQETIIDQQQTIEKFRELVRNLQSDLTDLRERGERSGDSGSGVEAQAVMNLNVQLKSAIKAHARVRFMCDNICLCADFDYMHTVCLVVVCDRFLTVQTIDFELRKLDAQQSAEHINLLNSFMPNSFFGSGGKFVDYTLYIVALKPCNKLPLNVSNGIFLC